MQYNIRKCTMTEITINFETLKFNLYEILNVSKDASETKIKKAFRNKSNFSLEKMTEKLDTIFEAFVPKKVNLILPKIDKIELPK